MFSKILIANRGEVALRILRAAHELGVAVVAVYSTEDADTLPVRLADEKVCIGPAPAGQSYLNVANIIEASKTKGAEDRAAEEAAGRPDCDFCGRRVLLVDDNAINREITKEILRSRGFVLEEAENGREAVDKVTASEKGYYDLILMDIRMPVMDGYKATEAIRLLEDPEKAKIPVVAMTANAFEEDVKAAKAAGMDGHIAKPVDVPKMMETITEVLSQEG